MKINKHIEIVSSSQAGLSSMSRQSRQAIKRVLQKRYKKVTITLIDNLAQLEALVGRQPDLVFLGMKFLPLDMNPTDQEPQHIWLASYLQRQGIVVTGSDSDAHKLELNKPLAKTQVASAGIKTARFMAPDYAGQLKESILELNFPVFVKPSDRGGGLGVDKDSVAHDFQQLISKVESISRKHGSASLIEEYLPGREFSVSIIRRQTSNEYVAMPIELVPPANEDGIRMLASSVKSANSEKVLEVTDQSLRKQINELAIKSFKALGASDYGRIDIRLDKNNQPNFLEANLIPSLIEDYGSFPRSCALHLGLGHEAMINKLVDLALSRANQYHDVAAGVVQSKFDQIAPAKTLANLG